MDYLWNPWRYSYIKQGGAPASQCVFCAIAQAEPEQDESLYVVMRGAANFIVLNRYPYTSGHAMVIPTEHHATLEETPEATAAEMMQLTRRLEAAVRRLYRAEGANIGMNVGKAAGAGVEGHIHMHVLPRWVADSNFMTVVGETRLLPENLETTWKRLRDALMESA
jgi:ATP adenylyltransferase